jgi:hypothetical protein
VADGGCIFVVAHSADMSDVATARQDSMRPSMQFAKGTPSWPAMSHSKLGFITMKSGRSYAA